MSVLPECGPRVRVTHVIIGLNIGGAELMMQRLITLHTNQPKYQHSVISLTSLGKIGPQLQAAGVRVVSLGMRNAFDLPRTFLRLRHELTFLQPDIVQTWMYHADFLGGLAARSVGIRHIIWGIRTTEIKAGGSQLTRLIRKACALLSPYIPTKIVCVANAARRVHERVGYATNKMLVIPNGFSLESLFAKPEQIESVCQQAGFKTEQLVVGSVGRFNSVKDHRNFIRAGEMLAKRHPDLRFLMVGRDLDQDNIELMEWLRATGMPERFVLFGERSDVPACLAAMDVFCLHSRTEGFPNVVGEAMAMGKPCVVTDVGDAAFLVGGAGVVVPKEDPQALAEGIETLLLLSRSQLEALGFAAQQRVHENFTMEHVRQEFEKLYDDVLSSSYI